MGIRPSKKYPTKNPTVMKKQVNKLKGIFLKNNKVEKKINPQKKKRYVFSKMVAVLPLIELFYLSPLTVQLRC